MQTRRHRFHQGPPRVPLPGRRNYCYSQRGRRDGVYFRGALLPPHLGDIRTLHRGMIASASLAREMYEQT
jgi:hypothetical protein